MKKTRILLVDDHALVRAGINSLLKQIPSVEVIGEADNGRQALKLARELHPNIVLMDIAMKEMNGLESTSRIIKEFPKVKIIILSMYENKEYILQALRAGAKGYLLKDSAASELELAVNVVSQNKTYLSPAISGHVVEAYKEDARIEEGPFERLTSRQREILQLIAESKTIKEIAFMLNLSPKTVETHRSQLMERLNIYDIPGLVRYAINKGIISSEK